MSEGDSTAAAPARLEAVLAELLARPLAEFTEARNAAAAAVRQAGDREAAEALKALRKPSLALWALNQVARADPEGAARLLGAGTRVRRAQAAAMRGEAGAAAELRAAGEEQRRAEDDLVASAMTILIEAGHAAQEETARRVRQALGAAATGDETTRRGLALGILTTEPVAGGFDALAGLELGELPRRPTLRVMGRAAEGPAPERRAERRTREAETMAREAEAALEKASAALEEAAVGSARAATEAASLKAEADRLAGEAETAARAASRAARIASEAAERHTKAGRRVTELGAAAARAAAAVEQARAADEERP